MKGVKELIGILLLVQGIGGGVSAVLDGSRSWFVQRYLLPEAMQVPASAVMVLVGLLLVWATRERRA